MTINNKIGFMQGRLSPQFNNIIQSFPWDHWRQEFNIAKEIGLSKMEWTIDDYDYYKNPIFLSKERKEIKRLAKTNSVEITSLTGDCLMQNPFWKSKGQKKKDLEEKFIDLIFACENLGISIIVIPLVDNGRIEKNQNVSSLLDFFDRKRDIIESNNILFAFESDFDPESLKKFINLFDKTKIGINYDIGNSASMGFNPKEEIDAYSDSIFNVHVKDRVKGGTTVALGQGDADFLTVFRELNTKNYKGNYILQTARCKKGNHSELLKSFKEMTAKWIENGS
tara:strand:- start:1986 stop:2828 length:843 start_codon:yes stop_codon:yes gene_type:complete